MLRHLLPHPIVDIFDEFTPPAIYLGDQGRVAHLSAPHVQFRQGARGPQEDPIGESATLKRAQELRSRRQHTGYRQRHNGTPHCISSRTNMIESPVRLYRWSVDGPEVG
jgi:hypothetical protein